MLWAGRVVVGAQNNPPAQWLLHARGQAGAEWDGQREDTAKNSEEEVKHIIL